MLSNLYFPLSIVGLTEIKLRVGQGISLLHCQVLQMLEAWALL